MRLIDADEAKIAIQDVIDSVALLHNETAILEKVLDLLDHLASRPWVRVEDEEEPRCGWTHDDDGTWETGCGNSFILLDDTPMENDMKFCCYCGRHIDDEPDGDSE